MEHRLYVYCDWLPIVELDALSGPSIVQKHTWGLDLAGQSGSVGVPPAFSGVGVAPASADGAASLAAAGGIGGLLATFDAGSPGTTGDDVSYIFCYDAHGNVGQLVDLSAETLSAGLVGRYEYDAYGNVTGPDDNQNGDRLEEAGPQAASNVYRFSTKPFDADTGMGDWGYRWYDPRTGRWVSRDPMEERADTLLHRYALNSPVLQLDALGDQIRGPGGRDLEIYDRLPKPTPPPPLVSCTASWAPGAQVHAALFMLSVDGPYITYSPEPGTYTDMDPFPTPAPATAEVKLRVTVPVAVEGTVCCRCTFNGGGMKASVSWGGPVIANLRITQPITATLTPLLNVATLGNGRLWAHRGLTWLTRYRLALFTVNSAEAGSDFLTALWGLDQKAANAFCVGKVLGVSSVPWGEITLPEERWDDIRSLFWAY